MVLKNLTHFRTVMPPHRIQLTERESKEKKADRAFGSGLFSLCFLPGCLTEGSRIGKRSGLGIFSFIGTVLTFFQNNFFVQANKRPGSLRVAGSLVALVPLLATSVCAQSPVLEDIQQRLRLATQDTTRILLMHDLANEYLATRPDTARIIARRGLAASKKASFDRGILYHQFLLASLLHEQGFDSEALGYLQKCLPLCKKLSDWEMEVKCYNEMAKWIEIAGNRQRAIRYYEKVTKIGRERKSAEWISTGLNNLGDSYEQMGNFSKAERYYLEGVTIATQYNDRPSLLFPYLSLGHLYFLKKDYRQSLDYSLRALPISTETKDWYAQVLCLNFATEALLGQNRPDEALAYTQKALKHQSIADADIQRAIAQTYRLIAQIQEKKGNLMAALQFHKQEKALLDSLTKIQNAEKVLRMGSLFESQRQEDQIKLLDAQNKKKVSQIIMLAGAVVSLLILVLLLYRWNLYRKRKNEQLDQKNGELWEQNNRIATQEEEISTQAEELRLMNERLYEWNQHLENLVQQRTQELDLQNKKLEEYAFINSHRLRSPITSIMGLLNIIRDLTDQSSVGEALQMLVLLDQEIQRLDKVTHEIQEMVNEAEWKRDISN